MQKAIVCNIDEKFLECGTEFSDRFVYYTYFTGLNVTFEDRETPVLPGYKIRDLSGLLSTYEDIYKLLDLAARERGYLDKLVWCYQQFFTFEIFLIMLSTEAVQTKTFGF